MLLTHLSVRNFKLFGTASVELGNPVVFVGPNNSGKTTALQALALWDIGLKRWLEKRGGRETLKKRPGVTINRRDIVALPIPNANLLWHGLRVREGIRGDGKQQTRNIRIDIAVEGISKGTSWTCGLEFDYANEESFYVRPLRLREEPEIERMSIPEYASDVKVAFLPPMSGLAAQETRLDSGAINVRLGEGRTAEVLRNLCYQVYYGEAPHLKDRWNQIYSEIERLFGVRLDMPEYIQERGEITMSFRDRSGARLDLSAAGRGLQQTLLLLTYMTVNPGSVILIDEPDAHLEILRQRQIYHLLSEMARRLASQLIVASHSEVVLNEAADRDVVVAFVGRPHRIDDRGSQVLKSLKEIGFDQYYQAEQKGWVLYLEGSTDLAILKKLAERLEHRAADLLERPFVHYVENQPQKVRSHFFGLREAKQDLVAFALYDRLAANPAPAPPIVERMWRKREIENYVSKRETLLAWARAEGASIGAGPLFSTEWVDVMSQTIDEVVHAMETLGKGSPWSDDTKVSDEFLDPVFEGFFRTMNLPNLMRKTDYFRLAEYAELDDDDRQEVTEVLEAICELAAASKPVANDPV